MHLIGQCEIEIYFLVECRGHSMESTFHRHHPVAHFQMPVTSLSYLGSMDPPKWTERVFPEISKSSLKKLEKLYPARYLVTSKYSNAGVENSVINGLVTWI